MPFSWRSHETTSDNTFAYILLQVLNAPESSPKPRPRPRPAKPRTSTLSASSVQARYGLSEDTYTKHRAASAERRKSNVYGDAAVLAKLANTVTTGVKTATDTGKRNQSAIVTNFDCFDMSKIASNSIGCSEMFKITY